VMARYGVAGKYLLNTESALVVWSAPSGVIAFPGDAPRQQRFDAAKANYVAMSNAAAYAAGIRANIWFDLAGWQASGLIDDTGPRPAFIAAQVSKRMLPGPDSARNLAPGELGANNQLMGYQLMQSGREIWFVWSRNDTVYPLTLPRAPVSVIDVLGETVAAPGNVLNVGAKPLYIVLP
jgi:hypothetical protein